MEEILKSAMAQVPALVVLAVVVMVFLRHMRERDQIITATITSISNDSIQARLHSQQVIEKNSLVVGENTSACREMTETMHAFMRERRNQ